LGGELGTDGTFRHLTLLLEARIFSVALFVTAITLWGSSPLPLFSAHAELQQRSAQRFGPEVVKVVLSMSDTTWENLRKKISVPARHLRFVRQHLWHD
jgi:hypothetical protein